ncbi:cytochrome c oxidase subunit I [Perkinsela sp. CCAP 1560/4]|nr:cytochrome c oxidase subunit I [Perkinsela sp. CCAP 1560/4]|eukprot:KNH03626.1 cytochrome c oxidase subunit I [Perkinsela sp. CCAP 1560/4]
MLRRSNIGRWYLAFNPQAKARPNFGLKGAGIYQENSKRHLNMGKPLTIAIYVIGACTLYAAKTMNIEHYIEEHAGGGPEVWISPEMEEALDSKPWEFKFLPGEGYERKPKYKSTGVPLAHLENDDLR